MNVAQGILVGIASAGVCLGVFLMGRHSVAPPAAASATAPPRALAPTLAAAPATPLPSFIMYPRTSGQPITGVPAAPAPPPQNASAQAVQDAKDTQIARDKDRLAEVAQSIENRNRMLAAEGKPPIPEPIPGFHADTAGNVYHFENGVWRLMSNKEIENPTPQEQAQASAGLAAALAAQGQRP